MDEQYVNCCAYCHSQGIKYYIIDIKVCGVLMSILLFVYNDDGLIEMILNASHVGFHPWLCKLVVLTKSIVALYIKELEYFKL